MAFLCPTQGLVSFNRLQYHKRIDAYTLFLLLGDMMEDSIRWTIKVSKGTDISLRSYLAQHGLKKGDLSKFVEEAVRWRVLDKTVAEVRERNANVPDKEIEAAIDEALAAVRAERPKAVAVKNLRKK
jgi:hypothetical protein